MAATPSFHLPDEVLHRYTHDQLTSDEAAGVVEHLRDCVECLGRLEGLASPGFMARLCPTVASEGPAPGATIPPGSTRTEWTDDVPVPAVASRRQLDLSQHPDYEIIRELRGGGMGVVYLAHNKLMGRAEVLKSLGDDIIEQPAMQDRFLREIRAVARLRHPNIVAAYHAFHSGEHLVFAMEYVEGLDLARMVRAKGPMPVGHACYFAYQAALALQHAHEEGMVHRDIKPGNLMLSHTKGRALIKVLDFGLAKASREMQALDYRRAAATEAKPDDCELTLAGQFLGTPGYVAPEQIADAQNADIRADIYSLGCTLYYLLSGHPPFPVTSIFEVIDAHRTKRAKPLNLERPDVPAALTAVVARMMEKQPEERFQTPAEVAKVLMPFFKKRDVPAAPTLSGPVAPTLPEPAAPTWPESTVPTWAGPAPAGMPIPSPGAGAAGESRQTDSLWEKLIEFEDTQHDSLGSLTDSKSAIDRPAWLSRTAAGLAGVAAIVLVAGLITFARRSDHGKAADGSAIGPEQTRRATALADLAPGFDRTEFAALDRKPAPPPVIGPDRAPASLSNQPAGPPAPLPAGPAPPDPSGFGTNDGNAEPLNVVAKSKVAAKEAAAKKAAAESNVVAKSLPPLIKAKRWHWIHDVPMPVFDQWVESMRARGYRPSFVNGHDLASQVRRRNQPDVEGDVRMAAIAVKDDRRIAFQVALDEARLGFRHYRELIARGYSLTAMSTFTNGTLRYVLGIYSEHAPPVAYRGIGSLQFPGDFVREWLDKGIRPFTVSCRPAGDFWDVQLGTKASSGVAWKLHSELSLDAFDKVLVEAKASGFRPESLFVCPGTVRGGFGVVLAHDDPSLLWEVRPNLTSAQLEPALEHMAEKGYRPDQVVGYSHNGLSRYVVCWTRNPSQYPATGLTVPALEALDVAFEEFLVEHHASKATMAVYRNGRQAMARGFGHADEKSREPLGPAAALSLADLSNLFAVAAVHSLVRKKKLSENTELADLLGAPTGDAGPEPRSAVPTSEPPLTLGRLLACLDESAPKLEESERKALIALAGDTNDAAARAIAATDLELQRTLLGLILEKATTKSVSEAVASELSHTLRLSSFAVADETAATEPRTLLTLAAPATEVGRFFLKNRFNGRPLGSRGKPQPGNLIGRQGTALAMIERRDDLLMVVMLSLPQKVTPELAESLRKRLNEAVDSLPPSPPTPGKRKMPR